MTKPSRIVRTADKELVGDLVLANRILFNRKILDGYGHVSVRHDKDPTKYLMSNVALVRARTR